MRLGDSIASCSISMSRELIIYSELASGNMHATVVASDRSPIARTSHEVHYNKRHSIAVAGA